MNSRFKALDLLSNRKTITTAPLSCNVSEMFGCNVYSDSTMKQYLFQNCTKDTEKS